MIDAKTFDQLEFDELPSQAKPKSWDIWIDGQSGVNTHAYLVFGERILCVGPNGLGWVGSEYALPWPKILEQIPFVGEMLEA